MSAVKISSVYMPAQTQVLERYLPAIGTNLERRVLEGIYAELAPADWSREVLAHARGLAVVSVGGSGWSDWGSPWLADLAALEWQRYDVFDAVYRGSLAGSEALAAAPAAARQAALDTVGGAAAAAAQLPSDAGAVRLLDAARGAFSHGVQVILVLSAAVSLMTAAVRLLPSRARSPRT